MNIADNQLTHEERFITIQEVKYLDEPNKKMIRLYCSHWEKENPCFNLQIRTYDGINPDSKGKKRNMVATAMVTLNELWAMVEYAKSQIKG